jgi:hypothetical protein
MRVGAAEYPIYFDISTSRSLANGAAHIATGLAIPKRKNKKEETP